MQCNQKNATSHSRLLSSSSIPFISLSMVARLVRLRPMVGLLTNPEAAAGSGGCFVWVGGRGLAPSFDTLRRSDAKRFGCGTPNVPGAEAEF